MLSPFFGIQHGVYFKGSRKNERHHCFLARISLSNQIFGAVMKHTTKHTTEEGRPSCVIRKNTVICAENTATLLANHCSFHCFPFSTCEKRWIDLSNCICYCLISLFRCLHQSGAMPSNITISDDTVFGRKKHFRVCDTIKWYILTTVTILEQ